MFILLIAMLALRGGYFVAGKFSKPVVSRVATRHSAVVAPASPATLVAPDPSPTDTGTLLWRGAYGADEDWA